MTAPYLEMRGIAKRFPGVQALKRGDLQAWPGEAMALIGANGAGKSTLMNVLGGNVRPDEGDILIGGQPVEITSPLAAAASGIAFVHQEMAMLPTMTVAENMHITRFPSRAGLIDQRAMASRTEAVLARLGCHFTASTRVQHMNTGDRQMVEIARALLSQPRIIIFDEPTSSLTSREKARLFDVIRSLKADGVTILYITHFLDEIPQICERATIMRGGETVGSGTLDQLPTHEIIHLMMGDMAIEEHAKDETPPRGEPLLRVTALNRSGVLKDIHLTLHRGEVLGLWGLLGSGRTEVARAIVGLDRADSGLVEIEVDGQMRPMHGLEAQRWIGFVTEDRRQEGLLLPMSVRQNLSLANLRGLLSRWGWVNNRQETEQAQHFVDQLNITIASLKQPVQTLSGGNQQKVVVGRWLQVNPPIFIMDEPTRGLDVSAKAEIRRIIFELAAGGSAVLVISSEVEEMMAVAQRYLVMNRGQITQELPGSATRDALIAAAAGTSAAASPLSGSPSEDRS